MRPLLLVALPFGLALCQPKPAEKKDEPKVVVAVPLGIPTSKETKIVLRGLRIDTATAVECSEIEGKVEIVRKGKAAVPNQMKPETIGDTEIEVKLPPVDGTKVKQVRLVVVTPAGKSAPHAVLVDDATVTAEKEPNPGYRQAQAVALGQAVAGVVGSSQDVDCFRFEGDAGQTVVIDVLAARLGSPVDVFLTVTDEAGRILAQADDLPDSRDARLEVTLPRKGAMLVTVQDAHDQGSPAHGYRLKLHAK